MVKQRRLGFTVVSSLLLISVAACQSSQAATEEQPTPSAPTSIRRVPSTKSPSPSHPVTIAFPVTLAFAFVLVIFGVGDVSPARTRRIRRDQSGPRGVGEP
uniref:hypothetical protein n=1 Tax=Tessaracoccus timonensis TaxID=2161816 RepID=UPI00131F3C79|nr:hypothetical protein [Tessaracoccus timonensis]